MASSDHERRDAARVPAAFADGSASKAARSVLLLERLADSLGVKVETFFEDAATAGGPSPSARAEAAELARLYLAIADPALRRRCLAFARAAASRGKPR